MNSVTILVFCVAIIAAVNGAVVNQAAIQYQKFHQECLESTKTDVKEIAKLFNNETINGEAIGAQLFCLNKKFNIQDDKGDINLDNLRKTVAAFQTPEDTELVLKTCAVRLADATPEQTAVELVKCAQRYVKIQKPEAYNNV